MSDLDQLLSRHRVVPVVVADNPDHAVPLTEALCAGGLPLAEVTFRTPAAEEVLRRMAGNPAITVGAGTVLSAEQVDRAVDAGAQFIVSPGLSAAVVERALGRGIPVVPGVATPSDLMQAVAMGLSTVKFFPAGTLGGPAALKALSAPFRGMRFVPTGGVTVETLPDYLALPTVVAVGGTWITSATLLAQQRFDEIRERAAAAVAVVAGAVT